MKNLRKRFDLFCFRNRDKGISNLMLYISIGCAIVLAFDLVDPSSMLYYWLCFDRNMILRGQLWRLFTYPFCYRSGSLLMTAIVLMCYYSLGQAIENIWGTLRFNLYYLVGILLLDIYCMIFGGYATAGALNMSLFLAYATLFPDASFLLFFIIPVKAWIFAVLYLAMAVLSLFTAFPGNLFYMVAFANYFLFFGADCLNVLPVSWRVNARRAAKRAAAPKKAKTIPFPTAGSYQATHATPKAPYTHRCEICGVTDADAPAMEFRYCSRCKGYRCYCENHISNHSHIQE